MRFGWKVWPALLALLLLSEQAAHGASGSQAHPRIERFGPGEGFTAQTADALLMADNGFLWIGTRSGSFRYDGYRLGMMGAGSIRQPWKAKAPPRAGWAWPG